MWAGATLEERRKLLLTVLDAVYVYAKGSRSVVEVRVKGAFMAVWGRTEALWLRSPQMPFHPTERIRAMK